MSAKPYSVHVSQEKLDQLKQKLDQVTFPDEIADQGRSRGPPLADIQRLVQAWTVFNWRAVEENINKHDNYQMPIEVPGFGTLDIHFIHQKSSDPDAIPLLFIHGWPGSILEVLKLLPLISTINADPSLPSFHLIAPSLPNFGFSTGTTLPSFGLSAYASTLNTLMLSLNYPRYATQSGDWGFWIARALAHTYPQHCVASHYNMIFAAAPTFLSSPINWLQNLLVPYTDSEKKGAERTTWFRTWSRGYNVLQSTRDQTLGYALADSPVALLAWIYEKLVDWADNFPWTDDEVLAWVSLYWFSSAGPAAAQRIYWEVTNEKDPNFTYEAMMRPTPREVKLGLTWNPKELESFPKSWGRGLGRVVWEGENESGGHFYAHERPEWLVRDLCGMFVTKGRAYEP